MAKKNMQVGIFLDGEKEFKKALKEIKEEQKLLNSESKLTNAIYADNKKSTEALSASNNVLTKRIESQAKAVEEISKRHKLAIETYGEMSSVARNLEVQLNRERTTLANLTNELNRNNEQIERNINSSEKFDKAIEKMANSMESVGRKATMFATVPIVAGFTAGVKGASDFSENVNKLEVAFDGATSKVEQFSKTALLDFGLSKNAVYELTSSYGMLGSTQEQSIELAQRSADMASIFNDSIENTSNALKAIYTGEAEPLKKYGVIMTEANVQAYALANGLENLSKEQQRYAYVMEETSIAQGDYKNTSDGLANTVRTITETFKEFLTNLGTALLPTIESVANKLKDFSTSLLELDEDAIKVIVTFGLIGAGIGPLLIGLSKTVMAIQTISSAMDVMSASAAASNIALGPIGIAIAGVTAVVGAGVYAWKEYSDRQEEARQIMIHSGDTAIQLAQNLEKANETLTNVTLLTDEYNNLTSVISDNNTKTEELASAKERLKEVEEELISIAGESGLLLDIENIDEYLPLLNERVSLEKELLEVQANSFLATNNYDKLVQEEERLKQSREELLNQIKNMQIEQTELSNIFTQMETAYSSLDHESAEYTDTMTKLNNELKNHGTSVNDVDDKIATLDKSIGELTAELEANNEETMAAQNSQLQYKQALKIVNGEIETDIANTTELANRNRILAESISVTNQAIDSLNRGEQLSSETTSRLIELYPELNSYVDESGTLNSINAKILNDVANASRESAIQQIKDEQAKTEATLKGVQTRMQAYAIEHQKQFDFQAYANGTSRQEGLLYNEEYLKGIRQTNELQKQLNELKKSEDEINKLLIKSSNETTATINKNSGSTARTAKATSSAIKDSSKETAKAEKDNAKEIEKAKEAEQKAIIKATKKRYDEEEELLKENLKEQLSVIGDKTTKEVYLIEDATNTKINLLDEEYTKKIELIDEATGIALQGINDEIDKELEKLRITNEGLYNEIQLRKEKIDLINAESEAEKEKLRIKKENERIATLTEKINTAETLEEREKAEKELYEYKEELEYNKREKERKAEIDRIEEEISNLQNQSKKEIEITEKTIKEQQKLQEEFIKNLADSINAEITDVTKNYKALNEALDNASNLESNAVVDTNAKNLDNIERKVELPIAVITEVNQVAVDNTATVWIDGITNMFENIANIFKENEKKWYKVGETLGTKLLNGLTEVTPQIESIIDELTTRIERAISLANELNSLTASNNYISNTNYNNTYNNSNTFSTPLNINNFNNNTNSDINTISKQLAQQTKDAVLSKGGGLFV